MEITIEDGAYGGAIYDTYLLGSTHSTKNFGTSAGLVNDTERTILMKVSLVDYKHAEITSARFGIDIYSGGSGTVYWYEVLKDWIEGTKNGEFADTGEPTWFSASHNIEDWETAGCRADSDRNPVWDGSKAVSQVSDFQMPVTTALANKWRTPDDNRGLAIMHASFVARSSEATEGNHPYFYMEFVPPKAIPGFWYHNKFIHTKI